MMRKITPMRSIYAAWCLISDECRAEVIEYITGKCGETRELNSAKSNEMGWAETAECEMLARAD